MTESQLSELIEKYLEGKATESQRRQLEQWYASFDERNLSFEANTAEDVQDSVRDGLRAIKEKIAIREKPVQEKSAFARLLSFRRIAAVAAVLLLMTAAAYFIIAGQNQVSQTTAATEEDFNPGSNKAVLTLGNGSKIVLDSSKSGLLSTQGGARVIKTGKGLLTYDTKGSRPVNAQKKVQYNTITVPRGGQYQIVLPDGSKVWLNAASFLRFPTVFTGETRTVQMSGEAYFEISPDAKKPFIVKKEGTTIKVLGTHFNVSAYTNEATMTVTLLEGSVVVTPSAQSDKNQSTTLKPGEQLVVERQPGNQSNVHLIKKANLQQVVAWKNGLFWFEDDDVRQIMTVLSRWYDVDIVVKGQINDKFTGSIPRNLPFSKVFEILQKTGSIRYDIIQHKIIVSP